MALRACPASQRLTQPGDNPVFSPTLGTGSVQPSSDMPTPLPAPTRAFTLADFDFALPPELIAQHPAPERSGSKLLDGTGPAPVDRIFNTLPDLLREGDLLVFNDTQVIKARIFGEKASGGKVEMLVERVLQKAHLNHELHANGTNLEGEWDEVMAAIRQCHEQLHAMGVPRIHTDIRLGTRSDRDQCMADKVASVKRKLG